MMRARSAIRIETKVCDLADNDPKTALAMLRITQDSKGAPAYQDNLIPQGGAADVPAGSPP
ncbi:hypothetical protein [Streptomyces sp. NPDC127038]|uniref:hypothetical protein n=1 Tax=Streptomyces sp. NPDC127038 TaxID=3347114 RepID=UPI00364A5081